MNLKTDCICGSGLPSTRCCERYISGGEYPQTAEALMRSRFTAFARRDEAYILKTWDAEKRPPRVNFSKQSAEWIRLEIVNVKKGGKNETKGIVQFKAFYREADVDHTLKETSRFRKIQGRWYYLDGVVNSIGKYAKYHSN